MALRIGSVHASAARPSDGRLLRYLPDDNLADGAAEVESGGFFDVNNTPPWDTWVGLFRGDSAGQRTRDELICWVPHEFVEAADRGIAVNPEQCIEWVSAKHQPE